MNAVAEAHLLEQISYMFVWREAHRSKEMLRVWSCNFFYSVICGAAVGAPPSGSLPVVNFVSRVARSDSGCSISPSTSHHIPQTCDSGVVRNRQGLSCRSASGSSGLAASSGCQLLRHHSLPVVFAQRSVLSNLHSALSDRSDRGVHPPLCRSSLRLRARDPLLVGLLSQIIEPRSCINNDISYTFALSRGRSVRPRLHPHLLPYCQVGFCRRGPSFAVAPAVC